jgi:hypothetical protein
VSDASKSVPQASQPTYELHSLGWKAFQQLCVSIAGEIWGQVVQGFFDSNDGGRDGAFYGTWAPQKGEVFQGSFTMQCKFSQKANRTLKLSDLADEVPKAERLAGKGLADNYFLFTNMTVTGSVDEQVREAIEAIHGVKRCAVFGGDRISQFIRESARLRMLVPRVYGLGDLSQILDQRAYEQAQEILSSMGDDMTKFVITDAYRRSAKALVEHGFVLLLGEPACGKSAIAATLSLGALDEWRCFTVKARDADDFVANSNPNEPKQFFWVDDAFGTTQLDWQATVKWNATFPHVRAAIRRGAKFVFTSRDYIYRNARNFLKQSALPVIQESQVVIRVEQLTKEEREQILYNHVRLGTQPARFKQKIKPHLAAVAAHSRFSPEIARRLGNPAFTKPLSITPTGLDDFVERPVALLQEVVRTLDAGSRAAIALVFMRGGSLRSPIELGPDDENSIGLLGASASDVRKAVGALEGSLLICVQAQGAQWWRAKHPTILDAFAGLVAEDRELMDIYFIGTSVPQLITEIACGDARVGGVKVDVPPDRYDLICQRVESFAALKRENQKEVKRFLGARCGKDFLGRYLARNPEFLSDLHLWSYLSAIPDVQVVNALYRNKLLPEEERLRHLAVVQQLAVETPDSDFLNRNIVSFITDQERADILSHAKRELLPNLSREIDVWRDNCDRDPDEYFSILIDTLQEYGKEFEEESSEAKLIATALKKIDNVVDDLRSDEPEEREGPHYSGTVAAPVVIEQRSIFDDVDQ